MVIVKIEDLAQISTKPDVPGYARVCNSSEITYLNETNYEVTFINGTDFENRFFSCKGWGCPDVGISYYGNNNDRSKCGTSCSGESRDLIRSPESGPSLLCDTPCENYENAYRVNMPGEKGYVIGCPNGLELYTAPAPDTTSSQAFTLTPTSIPESTSSSQITQPSNTIADLDKTSAQLSAGAILGIIFASIAGITLISLAIGTVGLFICTYLGKGTAKNYSFSNKMIADSTV